MLIAVYIHFEDITLMWFWVTNVFFEFNAEIYTCINSYALIPKEGKWMYP